jgi:hypothetical protein
MGSQGSQHGLAFARTFLNGIPSVYAVTVSWRIVLWSSRLLLPYEAAMQFSHSVYYLVISFNVITALHKNYYISISVILAFTNYTRYATEPSIDW